MSEIVVLGCHINDEYKLSLLSKNIAEISNRGYKFGISSNTPIPEICLKKTEFHIYDSFNKIFRNNTTNFVFENEQFKIDSPFLCGGNSDYRLGAISLFLSSILISKYKNYKVMHWMEFDREIDFEDLKENTKIINEKKTSIFYKNDLNNTECHIAGCQISVNLDDFTYEEIADQKKLIENMDSIDILAEKYIENHIFAEKKTYFKKNKNETNLSNGFLRYFDVSVFEKEKGKYFLFVRNPKYKTENFEFKTDKYSETIVLKQNEWILRELNNISFLIYKNHDQINSISFNNQFDLETYVLPNKFFPK